MPRHLDQGQRNVRKIQIRKNSRTTNILEKHRFESRKGQLFHLQSCPFPFSKRRFPFYKNIHVKKIHTPPIFAKFINRPRSFICTCSFTIPYCPCPKRPERGKNELTTHFFKNNWKKIWWVQKKCVPLHPQTKNGGSVAQLNRASDYGSEGCGFESRRNHKRPQWPLHGARSSVG